MDSLEYEKVRQDLRERMLRKYRNAYPHYGHVARFSETDLRLVLESFLDEFIGIASALRIVAERLDKLEDANEE